MCTRRPWWVMAFALALGMLSGLFAATHFKIKTDVDALTSPRVPFWLSSMRRRPSSPIRRPQSSKRLSTLTLTNSPW
jgi:hypothetical protein